MRKKRKGKAQEDMRHETAATDTELSSLTDRIEVIAVLPTSAIREGAGESTACMLHYEPFQLKGGATRQDLVFEIHA